jgi:hypothetical protein
MKNFMKKSHVSRAALFFVLIICYALKGMESAITLSLGDNAQPVDELCFACFAQDKGKVEELVVKKNVDINGWNTVAIKKLVKKDRVDLGFIYPKKRYTPLICAVLGKDVGVVKFLLGTKNIRPNQQNPAGCAALHFAVVQNLLQDSVEQLLDHGADINIQDGVGGTPLHYASSQNSLLLVRRGADMERLNNEGLTPLYYATSKEFFQAEKVNYLLALGAAIDGYNVQKKCPNLYWMKSHPDKYGEYASRFLIEGQMSRRNCPKIVPSLSFLCFGVLEKNGQSITHLDVVAYKELWDCYNQYSVEYKNLSAVIEFLQKLYCVKNIEQQTAYEKQMNEFVKKNFIPNYVEQEAKFQIDSRLACFYGPEWQNMNQEEKKAECCKIADKRRQFTGQRISEEVLKELITH